jgi:hypothetical protein
MTVMRFQYAKLKMMEARMTVGKVLDPTATSLVDEPSIGPDAGTLAGKRIGIRLDQIWRAWDWISEDWAERLRAEGAEVHFWRSCGRSGEEGERMERERTAWLAGIDIAIVGLANCGSCTGWTVRDAIACANRGIPTVAIATAHFEEFTQTLALRGGRSGLRVHVLPYPLNERERDTVMDAGKAHFEPMLVTLGATRELARAAA